MRTAQRSRLGLAILLLSILAALVLACLLLIKLFRPKPEPPDPHAGQVFIDDGFGMVWMTPLEGVAVNGLAREDFHSQDGAPAYVGTAFNVLRGADVSEHQQEIDWTQAAPALDFAYIRLGYRGYSVGNLVEDAYFEQNMRGALNNGLPVGVYLFSQATTVAEAIEEARFVLERLEGYRISLPVMFDWEKIDEADARTAGLSSATLTDCAVAFCQTIENAGYEAGVYFNRYIGYYGFDLSRLTDYSFWVSVPGDFPDFYYAADCWQYSFTASVPGIASETDMNLMFVPIPQNGEEKAS